MKTVALIFLAVCLIARLARTVAPRLAAIRPALASPIDRTPTHDLARILADRLRSDADAEGRRSENEALVKRLQAALDPVPKA